MASIKYYCLLFLAACGIYGDVSGNKELRNVIRNQQRLWQRHTMVYAISGMYDDNQILLIEQSMRNIEQAVNVGGSVCFSFEEKKGVGPHYLFITESNNGLCYTEDIGVNTNNRQNLYLSDNCFDTTVIQSLLVVTMGLYPEHQRPDRDQYIQVHMNNVQDAARPNFTVIPVGDTDLPYDFHSVTHYGPYQYAKDTSLPTITTNVSGVSFGDRDTLSFYDVLKVQTLYGCTKAYGGNSTNVLNTFSQPPPTDHYPQWFVSSGQKGMVYNNDRRCGKVTTDQYFVTVLNGATMMSRFQLPQGDYCVGVGYCIASCYHDHLSYIELTTGGGTSLANITGPCSCGQWQTQNVTLTADPGSSLEFTAHLSGGDLLALESVVIRAGLCA